MKAYSKQVQAEKQKERTRSKKDQISEITKLRKQRSSSGFAGDLQFDKDMKVKNGVKPDRAGQRIQRGEKLTLIADVCGFLIHVMMLLLPQMITRHQNKLTGARHAVMMMCTK